MKITQLADGLGWPEGPALLPDGRLVFVEIYRSQISVWAPGEPVRRHALVGGGPNATILGADGYLYVTQNGGQVGPWRAEQRCPPAIQRVSPSGRVETVATEVDGRKLLAPNDLAFGPDGRLYFTDPACDFNPGDPTTPGYIYALDPDGSGELLEEIPASFPNGIVADPDGSIVWVESYSRAVKRRRPDGTVSLLCTLPDKTIPDGLKQAANGDLYITGVTSAGLDIVAADGRYVGFLPVGKVPTNCAFIGSTLVVTDGGHLGLSPNPAPDGFLWAVELEGVEGMALTPGRIG
jgi:gluconolactonase